MVFIHVISFMTKGCLLMYNATTFPDYCIFVLGCFSAEIGDHMENVIGSMLVCVCVCVCVIASKASQCQYIVCWLCKRNFCLKSMYLCIYTTQVELHLETGADFCNISM